MKARTEQLNLNSTIVPRNATQWGPPARWCFWAVIAAAFATFGLAGCSATADSFEPPPGDAETLAFVQGEPVSVGEFRRELSKNYGAAVSKAESAGASQGKGFWKKKIPGVSGPSLPEAAALGGTITPVDLLKAMALESSAWRKALQVWARERGLETDISWESFLEKFHAENARRAQAKLDGEPVYGPPQWVLYTYYDVELAETEYNLKQDLEKEWPLDETELLRLYEEVYKHTTWHPGKVKMEWALADGPNAQQAAEKVWQAALAGEEMESAARAAGIGYNKRGFNLIREHPGSLPEALMQAALNLEEGKISALVKGDGYYWVFKCLEREEGAYLSFEDTRPRIQYDLRQELYKEQLDQRAKKALQLNSQVYEKITEQFIARNDDR
jgi:hypothetical protein